MVDIKCSTSRHVNFYSKFLGFTIGPIVAIFLLAPFSIYVLPKARACGAALRRVAPWLVPWRKDRGRTYADYQRDTFGYIYKQSIYIIFFVFPISCRVIFRMLQPCRELIDGSRWMQSDFSLSCETTTYVKFFSRLSSSIPCSLTSFPFSSTFSFFSGTARTGGSRRP